MPNRPKIPAAIQRKILLESGHRCAICGTPFPIERAHIIPWHKSKQHNAQDLICLCANCHELAEHGKWTQKTLRQYKLNPWVERQYKNTNNLPRRTSKVKLRIELRLSDLDEKKQRWLQYALAAFLDVSPHAIRITLIEEANSIEVTIELATHTAARLLDAYNQNDPELVKYLAAFTLLDLHREEAGREQLGMKKIIIVDDMKPSNVTYMHYLAEEIQALAGGRCAAELLVGVIITETLPDIKKLVKKIRKEGDSVKGLLIDFVDETHKVLNAGAVLLRKVKADPVLKRIPVVIYTGRDVEAFSPAALVKNGAKAAFRRRRSGAQRGQMEQGKQVLDAFGIQY